MGGGVMSLGLRPLDIITISSERGQSGGVSGVLSGVIKGISGESCCVALIVALA